MPDINLLPWREELREERRQQFIATLGFTAMFALLIGFLWASWREGLIEDQQARNKILLDEIAELESQVSEITQLKKDKIEMIDRMQVIKGLQTNRPEIVKIFDQLVRIVPDGTYLTRMSITGHSVSMEGKSESNHRISSLMREISESGKFSNPNLTQVTADRELSDQGSAFTMTAKIRQLKDPENEEG